MKKALAFLMAAVMLMSMLTACGNKDVADDTKDNNSIRFCDTREDIAQASFPTEKLLQNTESTDKCYVVPKVVE